MSLASWLAEGAEPEWDLAPQIQISLNTRQHIALGLAASALTRHQVAAYFLGFAVSLSLFLVGQLAPFLPGAARRLGVRTAYGLLTASAWLPLLEAYAGDIDRHTVLYPGAMDAVAALGAAGIPSGICTNKPEALAERLLRSLGVRDAFASLIGADTLSFRMEATLDGREQYFDGLAGLFSRRSQSRSRETTNET